eukprot:scaffold69860_cov60-Phaeocystis_antarctica.AAC.2
MNASYLTAQSIAIWSSFLPGASMRNSGASGTAYCCSCCCFSSVHQPRGPQKTTLAPSTSFRRCVTRLRIFGSGSPMSPVSLSKVFVTLGPSTMTFRPFVERTGVCGVPVASSSGCSTLETTGASSASSMTASALSSDCNMVSAAAATAAVCAAAGATTAAAGARCRLALGAAAATGRAPAETVLNPPPHLSPPPLLLLPLLPPPLLEPRCGGTSGVPLTGG